MRNLKPFEGRGIFYAKLLNERVVRAKGGISIDIPFCTDLYISPLLSLSSLVISLKKIYTEEATLRECHCTTSVISVVEFDV